MHTGPSPQQHKAQQKWQGVSPQTPPPHPQHQHLFLAKRRNSSHLSSLPLSSRQLRRTYGAQETTKTRAPPSCDEAPEQQQPAQQQKRGAPAPQQPPTPSASAAGRVRPVIPDSSVCIGRSSLRPHGAGALLGLAWLGASTHVSRDALHLLHFSGEIRGNSVATYI